MPPSAEDEDKLGYGSIVYADFYNSAQENAAGPHYAVVLDTTDEVKAQLALPNPQLYVVVISTKLYIHPHTTQHPVFPRWGLKGAIQGWWREYLSWAGVHSVWPTKAAIPEMAKITAFIRSLPPPPK